MPDDIEVLFRGNPRAALTFLRPLLGVGAAYSIVMTALDGYALWLGSPPDAPQPEVCVAPRAWIGVQALLQMAQLPVRVALLRDLRAAANAPQAMGDHLMRFQASKMWRSNKLLGAAHVAWFVCSLLLQRLPARPALASRLPILLGPQSPRLKGAAFALETTATWMATP